MNTSLRLLFFRARANWRLLGVVGLGILVASVLLAATTIYTRSITDLGLEFELDRDTGPVGSVQVNFSQTLLGGERVQAVRAFATASLDAHFGDIALPGRTRAGSVGDFRLLAESPLAGTAPLGGELTTIDGWESRARFEGRVPAPPALSVDPEMGFPQLDGPIEVAIPRAHAEFSRLAVGDAFMVADVYDECDREPPLLDGPTTSADPSVESCTTTSLISLQFPVEIVGIFDAIDPADPFWDGALVDLAIPREPRMNLVVPRIYALFVQADAFFGPVSDLLPGYRGNTRMMDSLPIGAFDSTDIPADLERFAALQSDIASVGGVAFGSYERTLLRFQEERDFSVVPILLILVQVSGIVFFFIIVMARLLAGREAEEIALLRSRGASLPQVLGLYTLQLAPIVLLAAAVAPLVAAAAVGALGFTGSFQEVTGDTWLATSLTPQAWALALAGAGLALAATLLPVALVAQARPGRARYVAARPAGANVIQRYYLDLAFVAIAAFIVWSVSARDAVFTRDSVGSLSTEPLVLIAPALIGLIGVVLVARLLPSLLRVLSRLSGDRIAMPLAAALRQAVRNPKPITQLSLLAMLAAALGTFAASYDATVDRSLEARARFEAGVDLRGGVENRPLGEIEAQLESLPGAGATAIAIRRGGSIGATGAGGREVQILGLDSAEAASMLWFRDDFSDEPLATLLSKLRPLTSLGGIALPDDLETLSLWVNPSVSRPDLILWLHLRDGDGRFFRVRLGTPLVAGEWQVLRGDAVEAVGSSGAEAPFTLHAVTYTEGESLRLREPGSLLLDDLTAATTAGATVLLEGFESNANRWLVQPLASTGVTDSVERRSDIEAEVHSGNGAMEYRWSVGISPGRRGLYLPGPNLCEGSGRCALSVIASETFLNLHGLSVGDEVPLRLAAFAIDVRIVDSVVLFPTLDAHQGVGFLLADVTELNHLGAMLDLRGLAPINEAWVSGPSDPELRGRTVTALDALSEAGAPVTDQRVLLETVWNDPLVAAGGSGILLVSFIAVALLVVVAFLVSVIFTARERMLEMAILRTLGIGRRTLLWQLVAEYALIAVIGLGLGTFLGDRIARLMLRFLEVDDAGDRVLPPFQLVTDWGTVAIAYLGLIVVLFVGVAFVWRLYVRGSITRALRLAV